MGLLDVINGMRNGPRGRSEPGASSGMSPITMAILALIAYKGIKHLSGSGAQPAPSSAGTGSPSDSGQLGGSGGDIGDLLNGLGGMLAGGAAGSILSGGLGTLIDQFRSSGQGDAAGSWVGTGPNQDISSSDLARSVGIDDIGSLARHAGLPVEQLLAGLARELPGAIDELTPDGHIPSGDELLRRL